MLLKRIYDTKLAQASYLIGCAATGEAIVVDPNRDIDQYLRAAADEGLAIAFVTETHIHADFVSGSRELAERTGAKLLLSDEGDANWKYAFASAAGATLLHDGDSFMVGNLKFDVLHTPGHTPEHLTFVVTDTPATDRPMGAITGDFIFVGDVGRPDLLEKAAKVQGTMEASARTLFQSLQRFKKFPDHLQIWPGHGAGSACGKALGAVPSSTLGYERFANWGLATTSENEFVQAVLAGQPEPPKYFAEMKRINKLGPAILGGIARPARMPDARLAPLLAEGALVIDIRSAADHAARAVAGTINIPLDKAFNTWAGWLVPYEREFYLLLDESCGRCLGEAMHGLAMIGLDLVSGYFGATALDAAAAGEIPVGAVTQVDVAGLAAMLQRGDVTVIDVRGRAEWEAGHMPNVGNIPVGYLADRIGEIPRDRPVVVHCQAGARSAIAASVLRAHGVRDVINLKGGFAAWQAAGNPVETEGNAEEITARR